MEHKKILIVILLIMQGDMCFSQKLDGIYIKPDCSIDISRKTNDTIIAYGSPDCPTLKVDSTINGIWIIYSRTDSNTILYQVSIIENRLNGIEYIRNEDLDSKFYINYKDGKRNGAFTQLSLDNKIRYFCDYDMGNPSGNSYRYQYNEANGKLAKIYRYNKAGKLKEVKEYDTGVYEKFYPPKKLE